MYSSGFDAAQLVGLGERHAVGHVAAERVVGAGLVGDDVGLEAARRAAPAKTSAALPTSPTLSGRLPSRAARHAGHRVVEVVGHLVEVARLDPALDAVPVDLDAQRHAVVHRHRQRLRAAHAAEPGGQRDRPGQRAAVAAPGDLGEALVRALDDALACRCRSTSPRSSARTSSARAPRGGGTRPRSPSRARGWSWRSARAAPTRCVRKTPTGLPDWTSSVSSSSQRLQRADDRVEGLPRARGAAGPAVDDEVLRALGHVGVEVVHQHPQGRLLRPAAAGQLGAARGADLRLIPALRSPDSTAPAPRRPPRAPRRRRAPARASGPAPAGDALADRPARRRAAPGSSGARRSRPRAAHTSSTARIRPRFATAARSLRAAPQPIDTWSSCIALVGSESTLAGAASRRFSATSAACV